MIYVHAPTEEKDEMQKDDFYHKSHLSALERIYMKVTKCDIKL